MSAIDLDAVNLWWARMQFRHGAQTRIAMYRMLYFMIRNGVNIRDALSEIHKRSAKKGKNQPTALMLGQWIVAMDNGGDFADAVEGWVPNGEQVLIAAGSKAGKLEEILQQLIDAVKFASEMKKVLLAASVYPALLIGAVAVVLAMFGLRVIPTFARISPPENWTGVAKSLDVMSNVVQHGWWIGLSLVVAAIVAYKVSVPVFTGKARAFLDQFPPYSYHRIQVGSSFLMSLAVLVQTGVNIERALMLLRRSADRWLRERLDPVIVASQSGVNLGDALERAGHGFPDPAIIDSIAIFAPRAEMDQALQITAREWMDTGIEKVRVQAKIMNMIGFLVAVAIVGWMAVGLFAIQQTIGQSMYAR